MAAPVLKFPDKTPGAALAAVASARLAGLALEAAPDAKADKSSPARLIFASGCVDGRPMRNVHRCRRACRFPALARPLTHSQHRA